MKMKHKVESKYKNPDRYVKLLKKEIDRALTAASRCRVSYSNALGDKNSAVNNAVNAVWGKRVNTWVDGIHEELGARTLTLGKFDPGDTIILVGKVTKVVKDEDGTSTVFFDRVETRRRSDD